MMVSPDSAILGYHHEKNIPCDTDHSKIAKIKRGQDGIYPDIISAIQKAMPSVGDLKSKPDAHYKTTDQNVTRVQMGLEEHRRAGNQYNASESMTTGTKSTSYDGQLKKALKKGDIEGTKDLIARLFDVNCKDEGGRTPLHDAAYCRSEPLVKLLLELGADRRAKTGVGRTTLHLIAHSDTAWIPLKESLIDLLLQHPPPLDEPTQDGWTPLMCAAFIGENLLAMKLISRGARVQLTDEEGRTALHHAAEIKEGSEMITLLITEGALVDAKDSGKKTPLHDAASECNLRAIKTLLAHGANPLAKGRTIPPGGVIPRGLVLGSESTTEEQRQEVHKTLKEAEKEWKRSGKKYSRFHWPLRTTSKGTFLS